MPKHLNGLALRARRLLEATRTVSKASLRQTDYSRWRKNVTLSPGWDGRNEILAGHIPAHSSVLDLGAGAQTLLKHLKTPCLYVPCDLVKSSADCLVCDFNRGIYPATQIHFDFVVCSGVLEYIKVPLTFLRQIPKYGKSILISYEPSTGRSEMLARMAHGWINHMSQGDLEGLFHDANYKYELIDRWSKQLIYRCSARTSLPGSKAVREITPPCSP